MRTTRNRWHVLRDKFKLGYAMGIDVAVQELQLAQAKALLPPLDRQFEQNRDLIRALVGNLPNQDVLERHSNSHR